MVFWNDTSPLEVVITMNIYKVEVKCKAYVPAMHGYGLRDQVWEFLVRATDVQPAASVTKRLARKRGLKCVEVRGLTLIGELDNW